MFFGKNYDISSSMDTQHIRRMLFVFDDKEETRYFIETKFEGMDSITIRLCLGYDNYNIIDDQTSDNTTTEAQLNLMKYYVPELSHDPSKFRDQVTRLQGDVDCTILNMINSLMDDENVELSKGILLAIDSGYIKNIYDYIENMMAMKFNIELESELINKKFFGFEEQPKNSDTITQPQTEYTNADILEKVKESS